MIVASILQHSWCAKLPHAVAMVVLAVAVGACAAITPYQSMSDARQAISAAEPVVVEDTPSGDLLAAAREYLEQAERYLRADEHERASEHAERARDLAVRARQTAAEEAE